MSCIHFKFKCDKKFDSVIFDGVSCTLTELKKLIIQKKGLSKHALDFDLLITNAQTKEVYINSTDVIQKNSSVIVARVPVGGDHKPIDPSTEEPPVCLSELLSVSDSIITTTVNESGNNVTSCKDFWIKASGVTGQVSCGENFNSAAQYVSKEFPFNSFQNKTIPVNQVPHPSYVCHRCNRSGHFKHMCPLMLEGSDSEANLIKRATGIPRSELIPLRNHIPGAYITPEGTYAIPKKDAEAILKGKKEKPPFLQEAEEKVTLLTMNVPPELTCSLCKDLFTDAVLTPCCNESFCDSCIRNRILESDESECPVCHQKDVSADQIHPNKFARDMVQSFLARSGYAAKRYGREMDDPDLDQVLTGVFTESKNGEDSIDELHYLNIKDEATEVNCLLENRSSKEEEGNSESKTSYTAIVSESFPTSHSTSLQNEGPIKTIDSLTNSVSSFRTNQGNVVISSSHRPVSISQLYKQSNNIQGAFSIPAHASAVYFSTPVVAATSQSIIASAMLPKPPLLTKDQFELIKRTLLGSSSTKLHHRSSRSRSPYSKYSSRYYHRKHKRHESKYDEFHSREHSASYGSSKNKKARSSYHSDNRSRSKFDSSRSSESSPSDSLESKCTSSKNSPLREKNSPHVGSKKNTVSSSRHHRNKHRSLSHHDKKSANASRTKEERSVSSDSNGSVVKRKAKEYSDLSSPSKKRRSYKDSDSKQDYIEKSEPNNSIGDDKTTEQNKTSANLESSASPFSVGESNSSHEREGSNSSSCKVETRSGSVTRPMVSVSFKPKGKSQSFGSDSSKCSIPHNGTQLSQRISDNDQKQNEVVSVTTESAGKVKTSNENAESVNDSSQKGKDQPINIIPGSLMDESRPKLKDTYNLSPPSYYIPVSANETVKKDKMEVTVKSASPSSSETDTSKEKTSCLSFSALFKAPASKWDRDSSSPSPIRVTMKRESRKSNNTLPRSIIETAEKVIFKPRLASLVAKKENSPQLSKVPHTSPKKSKPSSKHKTDRSKKSDGSRCKSHTSRESKHNHKHYENHITKKRSKHKLDKYSTKGRR